MAGTSEERVTSQNVSLDNCDREQIQYSNAIQPHAVLIVIDQRTHEILQLSANAGELRMGSPSQLIGRRFDDLWATELRQQLLDGLTKLTDNTPPRHLATADINGQLRDIFAHSMNGACILELERQSPQANVLQSQLYSNLRNGIAQLNASTSVIEFLNESVGIIARCTGFERVMAYRFQPDGSGEVVAEAVHEGLEHYLGLHYPAADIPKPARRLFSLTWLRHLPDVDYQPIPIVPNLNSITRDTVDLSYAFSRSVSVMYTEYLRNMGVKATMVLTLFKAGRLWGLISCMQHSAPRHLNIEVRGVCEMLAQTISLLMSAKEDAEFASYRASLSHCLERLNNELAMRHSILEALTQGDANILSAIHASGAAVLLDGEIHCFGKTPPEASIEKLAAFIGGKAKEIWSTDMISRDFKIDEETAAHAAGVLAARIGHFETDLLLWFRPEYRQTVDWAGDPSKLVVNSSGRQTRLNPNGSFEVWKSDVLGRAKPWLDSELEFASKLGRGIMEVVLERSRVLTKLNEDLSRSNRELQEFVYTATHDLKTPLRGIAGQTQLVLRRGTERLDEADRKLLQDVVKLALRMDGMIDGLLRYSELGHATLSPEWVDLNEICSQVVDLLQSEIQGKNAEIRIPRPLPRIYCDIRWVSQILLNLVANALKYNDKDSPWIEVGYREAIARSGTRKAQPTVLFVRDNGIGIDKQHLESVFRLFHRLHASDGFGGGAGLGLSIVARAVERHRGRVWLESELGKGTTFYFTLSPETN